MAQPLFANIPFQPSAGNHEQNKDYAHYINRFSNIPSTSWENNLQWSFDYSYLHIVIINNEYYFHNHSDEDHDPHCWDELARAHAWLKDDLERANENRDETPWLIVVTHRPLYCSNEDDPALNQTVCGEATDRVRNGVRVSGDNSPRQYALEPLLMENKVDLYLCGHKHNYERTYPIFDNKAFDKDYQSPRAIVQVLFGNAGNYEGPTGFGNSIQPHWSVTRYSGYGYSRFFFHSMEHLEVFHYGVHPNGTPSGVVDHYNQYKTLELERDDTFVAPWLLIIVVAFVSIISTVAVGLAFFAYEKRRGYVIIA